MFYSETSRNSEGNSAIALFHGGGWVFVDPSEFYEACRRYASMVFGLYSVSITVCREALINYRKPCIAPLIKMLIPSTLFPSN